MADVTQPQVPPPQGVQTAAPAQHEPAEIRKPDLQVLLQDLATSQRTLFEERRHAERRLAEERERSRWEQERIRLEMGERLKDAERQNDILVRTLGRFQEENERLRVEIAIAKTKANGHLAAAAQVPASSLTDQAPPPIPVPKRHDVSPMPGASKVALLPPMAPPLGGRPLPVTESPGAPPPKA